MTVNLRAENAQIFSARVQTGLDSAVASGNRLGAVGLVPGQRLEKILTILDGHVGRSDGGSETRQPPLAPAVLDPDTANVLVAGLLDKISTTDMRNLMNQLNDSAKQLDKVHAEKMQKYSEKMTKAIEEAKKKKDAKVSEDAGFGLSVAGSVLGMVGAVLLTIFTLGGGALAIAGAAIGLTTTLFDAADRIGKENNLMDSGVNAGKPMNLTLAGLLARPYLELVQLDPSFKTKTKDEQEKILNQAKMGLEIVFSVLLAGATIGCGVGAVKQTASVGGKLTSESIKMVAEQSAKAISAGAESLQVITDLAGAATSISSGAYGVQIAHITFEKNELDNQRQLLDTFSELIKSEITTNHDSLKNSQENIASIYETLSSANTNYYESQSREMRMMI